ncbi:hypothetical protein AVEN_46188-1 [Araneus ventricosus]|uniref:Uncharacterized protein n=1 Tax=Araneus ventricosus TaxID=182803 RepID=A0A4Y2E9J9_ARAVE|nr:hypothetical protein AVEN_46188-1 [Araneus ventricosus]
MMNSVESVVTHSIRILGCRELQKILWFAVSSTVGFRVEHRHLQSVCLHDVVLVDQTDENRLGPSRVGQRYSIHNTSQTYPQEIFIRRRREDDDVQHEVLLWMRQQPKELYAAGIGALIKRWD